MFKLSLPVQRFVAFCIILMAIIVIGDACSDTFWNWYQNAYDVTSSARQL